MDLEKTANTIDVYAKLTFSQQGYLKEEKEYHAADIVDDCDERAWQSFMHRISTLNTQLIVERNNSIYTQSHWYTQYVQHRWKTEDYFNVVKMRKYTALPQRCCNFLDYTTSSYTQPYFDCQITSLNIILPGFGW